MLHKICIFLKSFVFSVCCVEMCEHRLPWGLEEWVPGARIAGGVSYSVWMLGAKLWSSARTV